MAVALFILVLCQSVGAENAYSDSIYAGEEKPIIFDSEPDSTNRCVSHLRYDDIVRLARISPLDGLLFDASLAYLNWGPYGQKINLLSNLSARQRPGLLLDGVPLYDSELEDVDISWLPASAISSVCYQRYADFDSNCDSPTILLESKKSTEVPMTRIGIWWGDFDTRSINLLFSRSMTGEVGIGFGYEDLSSAGWVSNSASKSRRYFGRVAVPTGLGEFGVTMLGYDNSWDLPKSVDSFENKREQLGFGFKRNGRSDFRIDYWHISNHHLFSEFSSSFKIHAAQSAIERSIGSGIEVRAGFGYSSKQYEDSEIGEVEIDDSYGSLWVKMSQSRTDQSLKVMLLRNSLHGTGLAGLLTLDYRCSDKKIFSLILEQQRVLPKVSSFISKGSIMSNPLTLRGVEFQTHLDLGFPKVIGYGFLRKFDDNCEFPDSTLYEGKTYGFGIDLGFNSLGNLDLRVSYSFVKSELSRCEGCDRGNVLGWYLNGNKAITSHVNIGFALLGRWVWNYDFELSGLNDCFKNGSVSEYIYAIPLIYVGIDRTICFVRWTNVFDYLLEAPCNQYKLPGRTMEFGMVWHLLD
ncbi:MAG: hypothetical protein ACUVUU_06240 [bacterium]